MTTPLRLVLAPLGRGLAAWADRAVRDAVDRYERRLARAACEGPRRGPAAHTDR
jgi:hypothetical protein